jgi:PAS domain S-box-containing protein
MSKRIENPPVILVVNDDRAVVVLLTDLLASQGYKIISASSAYEALEITSARRVDLVVSDIVMPGMDGMELCCQLKCSAATASTPVLLVSAIRKDPVDFSEGFAAGADEYIEIPFKHEEFLVKVARLVERQRTEDALRKQNAEYRLLFDANPCPMYVVEEATLRFLDVNEAAVKHYGYSREEFMGMTALAIRPEEEIPAVVDYLRKSTAEYDAAGVWKHRKKNGVVIDVEVNWHRLKFGGRPAYLVSVNDITEQKRAAIAAVDSERRYRELFENANDTIYTHDLAGNFTSLNKTGERVTGYSREEALRMNIADVLTPESTKTAQQMLRRKKHEQVATVYELEIFAKDGQRVSLEVSTRLVYQDGRPVGVQGIARDITSRKAAEYALKESEEKFRSIVETTNEWVWAIDLDGRHTYTNPAVEVILGYSADEVLGKSASPFLHDEDRGEFEKLLPELISERKGWNGLVLRWKHKHDGYRYLESNGVPVFDRAGKLIGYRGADRDITERKLVEQALAEQAERAALINRISQAVRRTLDVSQVFQTAVRELGGHLGVDRCSLFMKNERAGRVVNVAEYHVNDVVPAGSNFDLPQVQELNEAMEKYGVLAFDDVANDEMVRELYRRILKPFGVKSIMYVGLSVGDELLGAFALSTTKQPRHWSEIDIEVAKAAADQTGIAIRQARLYQKAEATSMREALVNKLSLAIRASLTLADVLDTAARELGHALSASRVQVRLCNSGNERSAQTEYLAPGESSHHFDRNLEKLINQHFAGSTEPLVISESDVLSEAASEFVRHVRAHTQQKKVRSQIHYPLTVNGELSGIISIYQMDAIHSWDEDEILLVESVAAQLATGIAQAELFEMVARAKKEWESTFDAMSDGIFIFNRAGRLSRVNRAGATMDNSRPEKILGRQCCDVLKATSSETACIVEQAFRHQKSINIEVTPENLKRPVLVTCEPVFNESGQTVAAVCTARDLSELRTVEAVARERQSLLQNILESARESIYALDMDGRYKWCNQAMIDVTGYQMDELIGHHSLERVHEDDREQRWEKFAAALAGEPQSFESRYFAADGTLRYVSINNAPIIVDGETRGVLGIAHDITEQKQERERAARADKLRALGQLASGVAHDFNNSLAAILGRAQLVLRRAQDEEIIRSLGIIVTAAEDAAATVRRIQTFARKPLASELELLDMGSLLRDAIEITRTRWENEARAAGINIEVSLNAGEGLLARGNASELREVFVNLIVNAVDAMPQGGTLNICCKRKGDRLRLRFADTGKGMTDEVRERIFEPFYTTKGAHGTGLGLAVSYGIIERHEGFITVESKVGCGTTFHIDLPFAAHSETREEYQRADVRTSSLSVLVVDDEPFVRETLADMLADLDHRVVTAQGGREAVEKVATDDFDLVFTDLAMPEMDGWETARAIREQRPDLPVVLVTGYGSAAQPPSGEQDLVAGIIGKPFDFDQVTGTIARVCSGSSAHA